MGLEGSLPRLSGPWSYRKQLGLVNGGPSRQVHSLGHSCLQRDPPPIPHRPSEALAPFQFQVFLKQINSSLVDSNMLVRCVTLSLDRFENQVDMKGKKNP